jgi:hypothetical protein
MMVVLPLDCRALLVRSDGAAADGADGFSSAMTTRLTRALAVINQGTSG